MFDIQTTLKLKGRHSTYEWNDQDAVFTATLQGALLSVLVSSQAAFAAEAAGVAPADGGLKTEAAKMDIRVTESLRPFFSMSVDFSDLTSVEAASLIASLNAAVAAFKPSAKKIKG